MAGSAPEFVYAREVLAPPPPPHFESFNRKDCSIILFEIGGFYMYSGCHKKLTSKAEKYHTLTLRSTPLLLGTG
jgi:hypothetical protein